METSERDLEIKPERIGKGRSILESISSFVVIDLETTGLDPACDSIIEIGAVRVENGVESSRFQTLVNPGYDIDEFISEMTGITNSMLSSAPTIEQVLPSFLEYIDNAIVVGHNVNFDVNFIYDNCIAMLESEFGNNFIDIMRFSRRLYKGFPNHKLQTLIKEFGIATSVEHRALSDAIMTWQCYERIKSHIEVNSIDISLFSIHIGLKAKDICSTISEHNENGPLHERVCVFTGTLERMARKDAMQLVVNLGGICGDNVTAKTNYLILGNNDYCSTIKDGKSNKQKKAEQLILSGADVSIISEDVFYDMISGA